MHSKLLISKLIILLLAIYAPLLYAQPTYTLRYSSVTLDTTYAQHPDTNMQAYILLHKAKLDSAMNKVIGFCPQELQSFAPQSPLSNLLTDLLYDIGSHLCMEQTGRSADLSLLNFGGIRTHMPAGNITIETIYNILPFDNSIVIILLKGSELKKIFENKTLANCQPYSHAQVFYENSKPVSVKINHKKIKPNKLYRLVTIDFIQTGGDQILEGVKFEDVITTQYLLRTAIMDYIIDMQRGAMGRKTSVISTLDNRVMIKNNNQFEPHPSTAN